MAKLYLFGPAIQTVFVIGFLILVVRSRRSVAIFEEQLRTYNHETSSLLLKVQRIEQNSQTLHKHIGHHLGEAGMGTVGERGDMPFLSEDLHEKAVELQAAIQERDYTNIVERYGEGPIKVAFDLGLGASLSDEPSKGSTTLDIVLWSDTPHASWTLLDQIGRGVWDGAQFRWNSKLAALEISPTHDDPQGRGLLEFAEHISNEENWHDVWTVGLRQDPDTRRLQLFFNLKDNSYFQEHETCIGRVLGGFAALQTALRSANNRETNDGKLPSISVQKAVAKHLTRREIDMATK
jgi:cyclophilin family peptidyl-prolyl cis-trans isomerase